MAVEKFLNYTAMSMKLTGLLPVNSDNRALNQIHKAYRVLYLFMFTYYLVTVYIEVFFYQIHGELFDIINNLTVTLLFTVTAVKTVVSLSSLSKRLMKLIYEIEHEILSGSDEIIKKIHLDHGDWAFKLSITFVFLGFGTLIFFCSAPLIVEKMNYVNALKNNNTDSLERQFALVVWHPFDEYEHYILATLHIWINGGTGAFLTLVTDGYMWTLILFGISQIKILQYKLQYLEAHSKEFALEYNVSLDEAFIYTIRKCIILHQSIIKYVKDLNKLMSRVMLVDFAIASVQIAALGLELMFNDFGLKLMVTIVFLMTMLFQLFVFYWYGNELTLEAMAVSTAIWDTEFYKYPKHIQGDLRLVMMRSQIPLVLEVGPFYTLSNGTAVMMMKSSYSYMALINQLFKDV